MKIVTYLLGALLAAALGAAALFYFTTFQPLSADYIRLKAGMPELDKAKAELNKFKEKEAQHAREVSWINPVAESFKTGLASEISAGKAEVAMTGSALVVNIDQDALYTPESKTFSKDTQTRYKLAGLLKNNAEIKGKDIFIGNTTEAVVAHGKGRKKVPSKDALALASERSVEMVKYLGKEGLSQDSIAAVAYSARLIERGFKIKNRKTMIIIGACPGAPLQQAVAAAAPAPAAQPKSAPAGAAGTAQPKTIPIKPAQPKTN